MDMALQHFLCDSDMMRGFPLGKSLYHFVQLKKLMHSFHSLLTSDSN